MEPQALFTSKRFQIDSPVTAYCGDKTCQYALTRLLSRCDHTDDTVMQEVVGLLSTASTSCDNATVASPPPPPPGARTYSVVVMMHSGDEMDQSSVRDVMVTMLGCQEEDIRGFKPTGVKGTYSFVLVTYVLNKDTINSLLEPVGDVAVTTMYGSDMSSEEMGDGGPARSASGQGPNPADPGFNFFLMFGMFAVLAHFSFGTSNAQYATLKRSCLTQFEMITSGIGGAHHPTRALISLSCTQCMLMRHTRRLGRRDHRLHPVHPPRLCRAGALVSPVPSEHHAPTPLPI